MTRRPAITWALVAALLATRGFGQVPDPIDIPGDTDPVSHPVLPAARVPPVFDQHCVVSILNRTAVVAADGTWSIPNVPTNFGPVRARSTCTVDGETYSGQSDPFVVPANGTVGAGYISFVDDEPVPTKLDLAATPPLLQTVGATSQITAAAVFPGGGTIDVTADEATSYRTSNPAIATVDATGLVAAVASGTTLVTVLHEGLSAFVMVKVMLSGADTDGDGIPDDVELANGMDPNDPVDAHEDADGDGLSNGDELLVYSTDPRKPDTDGDGIGDGEETIPGDDGFVTNPALFDTDGDGVPDGIEVATGSDPTDPASYDLSKALQSLAVKPASFALTVNTVLGEAFQQLTVTGTLIDGKTTIDLTSTARGTSYQSSDLLVCPIGPPDGRVFGGGDGGCTITVSNAGFMAQATATVSTFSPVALSSLALPGFANAVDVAGSHVYVAAGAAGLLVIDASDPTQPAIVGAYDSPGNANDVRVVGTLAYLADGPAGLRVVDVSDPASPVSIGAVATAGATTDLVVRGTRVVLAEGAAGVQVVDVTNPESPEVLGTHATLGPAQGVDVSADGTLAVVAERATGVETLDLTDPASIASLGSANPGGDARDVVLDGTTTFVADFVKSLTVVDLANPASPAVGASTPQATGGLLTEVTRVGRFAIGADVYFVNGVPIVDVSDPANPIPRAILDFSAFHDDNGTGIAADGVYLYLTAEAAPPVGTEDGTTGTTRLYIGQYVGLVDTAKVPPTVAITSPASGTSVYEGETVPVAVTASDDVAVLRVDVLANGTVAGSDTSPPYEVPVVVPGGTTLVVGARAVDPGNDVGMADDVTLTVLPDPLTTVEGTVAETGGAPVEGATVTCDGVQGITAADGTFSIGGVPTVHGKIRCAAVKTTPPPTETGRSAGVSPVRGAVTDVGTITIAAGKIYYSRQPAAGQANGTIWRANTDGSGEELVTSGSWPRLSPAGDYVAFLKDGSGITFNNKLMVRELATGTEVNVHQAGDYVVNYDWTADGLQLVFDWVCSMRTVNRDGTNETNFFTYSCYDDAPARNAVDGRWAFHSSDGLYLTAPDGSGRTKVPNTAAGDYWVAWSPDGQWLSYGHTFDNVSLGNYYKIHPDGTAKTPLTLLDPQGPDHFFEARAWSPDGATLVAPGVIGGVESLWAIATDGSGVVTNVPIPAGEQPDFVGGVTGTVVATP